MTTFSKDFLDSKAPGGFATPREILRRADVTDAAGTTFCFRLGSERWMTEIGGCNEMDPQNVLPRPF